MKSNLLQARSTKEHGQGFAEYALLLVFIAIATILVVAAVNAVIESQFIDINKCMQNRGARALTSTNCEVASSGSTTSGSSSSSASGSASGSSSASTNANPIANFTYSCTNLACSFTSTSTDSDGTIASYAWQFGETSSSSNSSTSANPSHTYAVGATYQVRLTVTDNEGGTRTTIKSITVTGSGSGSGSGSGGGNVAPVAAFTSNCVGLACTFTNTSSDSDGTIASYAWDFTNNGSVDNTTASPGNTYSTGGTYTVKLTVTDNGGLTNTVTNTVTVTTGTNVAPVANFTFSCPTLTCTFTDTSTDDGTISSYAWDFTNNSSTDSTIANPNNTYSSAGTYTIKLTVTDNGGLSNSTTKTVTVSGVANVAPVANFTSNCVALVCTFSSSSSSDSDGTISSYAWDFTNDGSTDGTTANPSNTYSSAGTFTVKLTVTDNGGLTHFVTKTVTVSSSNNSPTANITNSCLYLVCDFSGSTSTDSDGTIASYAWSFGDSTNASGSTASHTYTAGTYTVTLTVTDNGGATGTTTKTITVAPNQNPVASFNVTCVSKACSFTSTSTDDGSIASYAWDFDNNGTTDATGSTAAFTYTGSSSKTARLTVTDNTGLTGTVTKTFAMNTTNAAPTANFTFSCTYLVCSFTDGSSDSDGTISSYAWTFGDSTTSTSASPSKTYSSGGSRSVTLTVTDDGGLTNSITKTVTVAANVAPTANFTFICTNLACTFTNSASDSDGTISSYAWTFGDSTTSTAPNPSKTYSSAGTRSVTLTVTDNAGLTGTITKSVTVTANVAPTANFTSSCTNLACTFTNTSTDDVGVVSSAWTFGDSTTSSSSSPSKTYASANTYSVTLTVTDAGGLTNSITKTVTVTANVAPTANFTFSCTSLACTFTNSSSDSDGTISSYAWDFTSDSVTDSTIANPSNTFSAGGTYSVKLTVTDNGGLTGTVTKSVTVTPTFAITDVDSVNTMTGQKMNLTAVTLTIRNTGGTAVSGVIVTVTGSVTCTSDSSGICTLNVPDIQLNNGASQAYSIVSVTGGTGTYNSANNANTDADTHTVNASTITINN